MGLIKSCLDQEGSNQERNQAVREGSIDHPENLRRHQALRRGEAVESGCEACLQGHRIGEIQWEASWLESCKVAYYSDH